MPRHYRVRPRDCELSSRAGTKGMIRQMPFKLSLVLSTVAAVFKDRADLVAENGGGCRNSAGRWAAPMLLAVIQKRCVDRILDIDEGQGAWVRSM